MTVIKSKTCTIIKVDIITSGNKILDISRLMKGFRVEEAMPNIFLTGAITFDDQHNIRESLPIKGDEIINLVWSSSDNETIRNHRFMIAGIPGIKTIEENKIKRITINLVDEKYLSFIQKEYYVSWVDKTNVEMIEDLLSFHNLSDKLIVEDSSEEKTTRLNLSSSSLKLIDEIEHLTTEPFVLFQRDNDLKFTSFKKILLGTKFKELTTRNTTIDGERNNAVFGMTNIDVIDNIDLHQHSVNGYKYFDVDPFEGKYEITDKLLDVPSNRKFEIDENVTGFKYTNSSMMKEDYFLMDAIVCQVQTPSSNLFIGDLIVNRQLKDFSNQWSWYSGTWLLYSVQHIVDENYEYKQQAQLIREQSSISSLF